MTGEADEGETSIVLHKVKLEDSNLEVLMDDQSNIYDMEVHYIRKLGE